MDEVRQWWLLTAWPTMRRIKWFIAAWVVLVLITIPWGLRAEERSLEEASRVALSNAGVVVEDISFTGRNAVVAVASVDETAARSALADVDGLRRVEFVEPSGPTATAPPPTTTTTTTTATTTLPPQGDAATVTVRVGSDGTATVDGMVPDAAAAAEISTAVNRFYGPGVENRLTVSEDRAALPWLDVADDVIASLPTVTRPAVTFDVDGVKISAIAPTRDARRNFLDRVAALLDVPLDHDVEVADGGLPALEATATDGSGVVNGSLWRRKSLDAVLDAVGAVTDAEPVDNSAVDKTLSGTHIEHRLPNLVYWIGGASSWSVRYEAGMLDISMEGSQFRGRNADGAPTARLEGLIGEVAALMVGDNRLDVTIVATAPEGTVADDRAELLRLRLIQAGVDPERILTSGLDDEREILRFSLGIAER